MKRISPTTGVGTTENTEHTDRPSRKPRNARASAPCGAAPRAVQGSTELWRTQRKQGKDLCVFLNSVLNSCGSTASRFQPEFLPCAPCLPWFSTGELGIGGDRWRRVKATSWWLAMVAVVALGFLVGPAAVAAEFLVNGQRFTVPEGFEVELAAGTNLVPRPVSASFDDQGRLYVTDSSGSNDAPQKQLANPTHRILRLEDTRGDGKFDKSTVFAEKVMFPQGCLWHAGSVYVAAPPSIWKFTDADGDGVAERREEWFKGGTLTGCANDIHGPYLGPDGYIYWTKGAFAEQTHRLGNGRVLKDRAAHIYRARPDGSDLDVIMSGGMDNPVEVAFTPEGEALFTSTFIDFSEPGWRDGMGHAVLGGVYGKQNEVLEDGQVKRTSPALLHPFYQAGPGAECGLTRYQGGAFGAEYRDNIFSTSFNLHKVTRHVLRLAGASYASTNSDFLVSDSQDFHPTDVLEAADGSLLVVDTGGWYKLCCPSSQLVRPDVFGAIYRVRRKDAPKLAATDRSAAYRRITQPPAMSDATLPAILKRAVWKGDATNAIWFRAMLEQHARKAASNFESAHVTRIAAEGLGRLRDVAAVPGILQATRHAPSDVVLQHSLTFALIQIAARSETRPGLKSDSPAVQRAALMALDQMDESDLKSADVVPLLQSGDKELRAAAIWVLRRHPGWASEMTGLVEQLLTRAPATATAKAERNDLLQILAAAPAVQTTLAGRLASASTEEKAALFECVAQAQAKTYSPAWIAAIREALTQPDPALTDAALTAARRVNGGPRRRDAEVSELNPVLLALAQDPKRSTDSRLDALLAVSGRIDVSDPAVVKMLLAALDAKETPARRGNALQVLLRAKLDRAALEKIAAAIPQVSPLELLRLLAVFEPEPDEAVGRKVLAALQQSKAARSLPAGNLKSLFARYPAPLPAELNSFLETFDTDLPKQAAHLDSLLGGMKSMPGDIRRGQSIFNGAKASCLACHKIGYVGGTIGPDLTNIGQARSERDLLEAIVYPSASFVRSYEPMVVSTQDGEEHSGVLRKDSAEEVVLATGANAEIHLPRKEVAGLRPGTVSVMPQGLDEQLTRQELADLLAFLQSRKP